MAWQYFTCDTTDPCEDRSLIRDMLEDARREPERCPECGAPLAQDGDEDGPGYCPACDLVDAAAAPQAARPVPSGVRW